MSLPEELIQAIADEVEARVVKPSPVDPRLMHLLSMDVSVETREVFIQDEVTEETGSWFNKVHRHLVQVNDDPITIWLCTPGGDMRAMFMYHDIVTTSPVPITVVALGEVASAGCLMLACASRPQDNRLVMESTTFMWHEARGFGGDLTESEAKARRTWEDWTGEHWRRLMARHVQGKNTRFWQNVTNKTREHWELGGKDIVAAGIADDLYRPELLPAPARR